jgi:hypothetical protein
MSFERADRVGHFALERLAPDHYAIITTGENGGVVRRDTRIGPWEDEVRTVEVRPVARREKASHPHVECGVELELCDRVQHADVITVRIGTTGALGVERSLDHVVVMGAEIKTHALDSEVVGVRGAVRSAFLETRIAGPQAEAGGHARVIADLELRGGEYRIRGRQRQRSNACSRSRTNCDASSRISIDPCGRTLH